MLCLVLPYLPATELSSSQSQCNGPFACGISGILFCVLSCVHDQVTRSRQHDKLAGASSRDPDMT